MTTLMKVFDGVTADTTSNPINVEGAKKIMLYFFSDQADSDLTMTVSFDGTNYVTYNKLISNAANTNGQTLTRTASITSATTPGQFATVDPDDGFPWLKLTANEDTGATMTAWIYIEY